MEQRSENRATVSQNMIAASRQWVAFLKDQLASGDGRDLEDLRLRAEQAMTDTQLRPSVSKDAAFSTLGHALERLGEGWLAEGGRRLAAQDLTLLSNISRQQASKVVSSR